MSSNKKGTAGVPTKNWSDIKRGTPARRTLIVGDAHGNLKAVNRLLEHAGATTDGKKNAGWEIGSIGDLLNMGPDGKPYRGFISDDVGCAKRALEVFNWITVGNHEVFWTHGLQEGIWRGMGMQHQFDEELLDLIREIRERGLWRAAWSVGDALVSHAGVTGEVWEHLRRCLPEKVTSMETALWLCENFEELMEANDRKTVPWFHNIGRRAGGYNTSGSIFWARPEEFGGTKIPFEQVIGHTPRPEHPVTMTTTDGSVYRMIDSGGYLDPVRNHLAGVVWDAEADQWWTVDTRHHLPAGYKI